jgi:hypothetical protein
MEPPSSHAEALRNEQTAPICAADGFLVASDELGDFESRQQPVGQALECSRAASHLIVGPIGI